MGYELTNEMIIERFEDELPLDRIKIIVYGIIIIVYIIYIVIYLKKKKETNTKTIQKTITISRIIIMSGIAVVILMFCFPEIKNILEYNAVQYSIENNCFEVVIDKVVKEDSTHDRSGNHSYYLYLENNGKIHVSMRTSSECSVGEHVYVVIAKGKFGGIYPTWQIYSTNLYKYVNR